MRRVHGTHFIAMTTTGRTIAIADRWLRNADLQHRGDDPFWYIRARLAADQSLARKMLYLHDMPAEDTPSREVGHA